MIVVLKNGWIFIVFDRYNFFVLDLDVLFYFFKILENVVLLIFMNC